VQHKKKVCTIAIMAFLTLSMVLAAIPMTSAATAAITLTPTAQCPGASVAVEGTGFGATKAVGIGFGAEVAVTGEVVPVTGSGTGPWSGILAYRPINPGSFSMTSNVGGVVSSYTDNGDGTLASTGTYFVSATINYVTGVFSRISTADLSGYDMTHTVSYTRYQNNTTPAAGVTTDASGSFTASITVPSVANGNYVVTAIDTQGNRATATLGVDSAIPEGLTIGVMVLLSSVAVIVGSRYFRKRSRIESCSSVKL
jgi:hypothetical protein